ncbi:MAG: carboxypeptidase-like regulatory domain-containing protein [Bacteroidia bacterium]|nr:carboxypeptidase-like regulatory domain-containing protein [Bacteroidia bacterium]MDW8345575.1 carboxypeptidase-like regulatory domain-containing protein [Bacteroidia bacterium]
MRGKIIDKSQNPLPNIKVTIIELGITTYTNEQGEYAFCSFVEGTYTVLFDDGKTQRLLQNLSMPKRVIYNMEW